MTFEEEPVALDEMVRRIERITVDLPWLVFEAAGRVIGYSYASHWRTKSAYRHSAETTVYLAPQRLGKGVGFQLYRALLDELLLLSVHTMVGVIALPNPASIALHEKMGFQNAAHLNEVGRKFDRWVDVGYWQLVRAG